MIDVAQLVTLFFFLITSPSQEEVSGIYIVHIPPKRTACENELKMLVGGAKVCISKKPIIDVVEIEYASDIQYDPKRQTHYIDIGLTPAGILTLNKTGTSLPNTQFAIVIQGSVICHFRREYEIAIKSIRIGQDAQYKDLVLIHDALSKTKFD